MMAAAIQRQAGVKASLEELARVGASRAEDVRLLAEMQASLEGGALPPQIVARLGTECALREDWRRGRADEALRGLGAPLGGMAASAASALIEAVAARLLDDARLMADGLHRRALPWQRTLVAAASRIAADALDVARSALAEAEGAEAEGAALLDALQLALIETPAAELGSALALLTATARALVADPTAAAASAAAAPCVQPGTTSAPTLDSFVRERLRRRYDAQREGAARILQRRARVLLARRGLARAARARRVARLRALLRAGTGRRIATALAWLWQLRGWRRAARAARRRERAAAAAAAAAARAAYALLNASERTGWHAASRVQAAARGARARRRADALRDGWPVRRLQAAARGMLGRSAAARVAASRALRARRARAAAWARQRAERGGGTAAMMRKWLSINLHVTAELGAIDAELERERRRFELEFKSWEATMRKTLLAKKLPADWLPQIHPATGEAYYFNIATGEARKDHPAQRQANLAAERGREAGRAQMAARFETIAKYKEGVGEAAQGVRAACAQRIAQLRAEHVDAWLKSAAARAPSGT